MYRIMIRKRIRMNSGNETRRHCNIRFLGNAKKSCLGNSESESRENRVRENEHTKREDKGGKNVDEEEEEENERKGRWMAVRWERRYSHKGGEIEGRTTGEEGG